MAENERHLAKIEEKQALGEGVIECIPPLTDSIRRIKISAPQGFIHPSRIESYISSRNRFEATITLLLRAEGYRDDEDVIKMLQREELNNE